MLAYSSCRDYAETQQRKRRPVAGLRDLRQMLDSMKRMITGQGLEEESGETGDQLARREETEEKEKREPVRTPGNILTEESRKGKETAERSLPEDRATDIEMEGEHGTEEEETGRQLLDLKGLRPGTQMLATHSYKKNPNGPVGNELDLEEGDTLVYLMEHNDNESWWLAEDVKGVGYVPAAYLMIILDETIHEEESRKEGHEKRTDGTKIGRKIGQDGERRKPYSAAVIDGCERTSTIYVGDSIVRKTDRRFGKGKDVVVCLPGARIEHVTERVEKIVGRGKGGTILVHVGTNNAGKEGTTAIVKKYRDLLKRTKQARIGHIILSGILPVIGSRNQGYRNSRRVSINRLVQQLCKEEDVGFVDLWSLKQAVDSGLQYWWIGQRKLFKLVGQGGLANPAPSGQDYSSSNIRQGNAGLKCVGLNARSIMNKKSELNIMVNDSDPHIIGITESWANKDITDAELGLEGYVMFRKDRMGRRGEEEYYYTSKILYQHTKYNYGRKQIAKKPYGAN